MGLVSTPAILLRTHPFSESSLILRFFTERAGVLGAMARGIRRRHSKGGSSPEIFTTGLLTAHVRSGRDLQTFQDFESRKPRAALGRDVVRLGGASMIGELILRHGGESAAPELFHDLDVALDRVETAPKEELVAAILSAGWQLVDALGYRPVLEECVSCGEPLGLDEMARFDLTAGGLRCPRCDQEAAGPRVGPVAREQVRALLEGRSPELDRPQGHLRLFGDFVTVHVSGTKPLESVRFLASVLAPAGEPT